MKIHISSICCFLLCFSLSLSAQIPAFPGAEGFGALETSGGRGGQVLYVTNLNCEGPGSLNAALATPGAKYILFKVSGIIDCAASVEWGDCYIAGQTSPGGIIVRGIYIDDWYDPNNGARNIIIRHLNSRPHTEQFRPGSGWVMDDALRLDGASRVVVDHCTFANGTDEQVQISRSNKLSIQHCILAEPVGDHYMFGGMLLNYSANGHRKDSISIHHNVWNRVGGRFPELSCEQSGEAPADMSCLQHPMRLELSNNVFWDQQIETYYNSGFYPANQEAPGFDIHVNCVNNRSVVRNSMCNAMFRNLMLQFSDNQLFFSGNTMSRYPSYSDYQLFYCCNDFCTSGNHPNTELGSAQRRSQRHPFPAINYTPTQDLLGYVTANAGAFNGYSPGRRDPMNRRLLQPLQSQVIDSHPIDGQDYFHDAFVRDYNTPPAAPPDSDNDGMPDAWEQQHGLNPNVQDHNGTALSVTLTGVAGYTNLECYLNDLSDRLVSGVSAVVLPENLTEDMAIHYDAGAKALLLVYQEEMAVPERSLVQVMDSAGRLVMQYNMEGRYARLQLESCPAGVYVVRVRAGARVGTFRFVVP